MAIDFEAEGLLKGTRGKRREARRELLDRLAKEGIPLEELKAAVEQDRLALLPAERVLEGTGRRYTPKEIAEESGVELELLVRQRQALGLPAPDSDAAELSEADLDAAKRLQGFREAGIPDDSLLEVSRAMGMAIAQVAGTTRTVTGEALLDPGDTELDVATRFAAATEALVPMMGPMLEYAYRLHLREQIRLAVIGREELTSGHPGGSVEVSVCFADLVEFTKLGERLPIDELGALTGRLGELAREAAAPPVQLVKLIGDAAMLVSTEVDPLLDSALALVENAEAEEESFPLLRAGVAIGEAVSRGGDWYGRPVNLASRITDIARPSSVLCAAEVSEAAGDGYRWSNAGSRRVKGIKDSVRLARVRRQGGQDGGG